MANSTRSKKRRLEMEELPSEDNTDYFAEKRRLEMEELPNEDNTDSCAECSSISKKWTSVINLGTYLENTAHDDLHKIFPFVFLNTFSSKKGYKSIVLTKFMRELYHVLHDSRHSSYLITGPPRIGKTTALLWLYLEFSKNNPNVTCLISNLNETNLSKVENEIQRTTKDKSVYFFCDLNEALSANNSTIDRFFNIISELISFTSVSVYSASSAFLLGMLQSEKTYLRSLTNKLYRSCNKKFAYFLEEESKLLLSNFISNDSDKQDFLLQKTNGLPGFIFDIWKSDDIEEANEKISLSRYQSWTEIFCHFQTQPFIKEQTVQLLVCLLHKLSVLPYIEKEELQLLPPVAGCLINIDKNGVPNNCIGASVELLKRILKSLDVSHLKTDEGSALGFLFEPIACNVLQSSQVEFTKFILNPVENNLKTMKYAVCEHGRINLKCTLVLQRLDITEITERYGKGCLVLATRSFPAVDAITIVDNCLWLIQITTVQHTELKSKVRKFIKLSPKITKCIIKDNIKEVICVLISAHSMDDVPSLAAVFADIAPQIRFQIDIQPQLSFAVPVQSESSFQYEYHKLQSFLSFSI